MCFVVNNLIKQTTGNYCLSLLFLFFSSFFEMFLHVENYRRLWYNVARSEPLLLESDSHLTGFLVAISNFGRLSVTNIFVSVLIKISSTRKCYLIPSIQPLAQIYDTIKSLAILLVTWSCFKTIEKYNSNSNDIWTKTFHISRKKLLFFFLIIMTADRI